MDLILEQIRTGGDRNFAYLVGDRKAGVAAAVDPAFAPERVLERARAQGLEIRYVLNTHGHPDHTGGNDALVGMTGANVAAWKDSHTRPDVALDDGEVVEIGAFALRTMYVPGHTDDHVLFHLPDAKAAITGDHLFVGKIGGTGTDAAARKEYASLERTLAELPDETTIWPGHDYGCRPSSTIGLERITNPFLQTGDLAAFLQLKRDWADFKADNGLM